MASSKAIPESFFALKAVVGRGKPPLGKGDYLDMISPDGLGKWYRDKRIRRTGPRSGWPVLCRSGWHAFPLNRLDHWLSSGYFGDNRRSIWIVEMFGKAAYDYEKMCAEYIRFVEKLTTREVNQLKDTYLPNVTEAAPWSSISPEYERAAQALRMEGLVLCTIRLTRTPTYSPQLLRVKPAVASVTGVRGRAA